MAERAVFAEGIESRWLAFVAGLPGCFADGDTWQAAVDAVPLAMAEYLAWRRGHGDSSLPDATGDTLALVEVIQEWANPAAPPYWVSPFFAADAPPLAEHEVDEALRLLEWQRADLRQALAGLDPIDLTREAESERSIAAILGHMGRAEWWYLDRIGLAPGPESEPDTDLARLNIARDHLFAVLPALEGVAGIVEQRGELWSPRKVVRRALWHEREHTREILTLRSAL